MQQEQSTKRQHITQMQQSTATDAPTLRFVLLLAVFLGWVCVPAAALDNSKTLTQYMHRVWGQEEGLLQPTVYSILQTRDGFLWLGTQDSLIRFDGAHFREYQYGGRAVLHGSLVRALHEDHSGNLWVATIGNGLAVITANGRFQQYSTRNGLPGNNVLCLDDRNGQMLACTEHGLAAISPAGSVHVLDSRPVRATCETADGNRWSAAVDGSLMRNGQAILAEDVSALLCARDGSVWAGTNSGVVQLSAHGTRRLSTRDGLPDNAVDSVIESIDGSIWIGTDAGISRYHAGELSVYRTRDGLSHSVVLSMYFDREGNLWAGTKDGLDQFTDAKLTPYTTAEGLSSNEAGPLAEDRKGNLWIGTLDAGLNVFDGRKFRKLTRRNGLASNTVLSLAVDRSGDIWAGTSAGLNRLHDGVVIATLAPGKQIRALMAASDGSLWVAMPDGVAQLKDAVLRKEMPSAASALGEFGPEGIFVSTRPDRLTIWKSGSIRMYPVGVPARAASCYLPDSGGHAVWIGMLGGLVRWKDGQIVRIHIRDGLWDSRLYALLRDRRQNLWIASSKGIFQVSEQQLNDFADGKIASVTSIPFSTGQLRFECRGGVQPAALKTHDGKLWFSTTSGVVVVDPDHLISNRAAPPVGITAAMVDGQRVFGEASVRLRPGQRNLEIRYAGLTFVSPERVTFRYILEGFDKQWTDANTRREAFFTNLPPGRYTFRVMAQNADGLWSNSAAALDLEVLPSLYERLWFWPAVAIVAVLVTVGAYRWRVRRLKVGFNLVLAERTRIARELHDTLLQGFSGVTMQLQALWMRMPASKDKQALCDIIIDAGQCSTEARQSLMRLRSQNAQAGTIAHRTQFEPVCFSDKLAKLCNEAVSSTHLQLWLDLQPIDLSEQRDIEYQMLRIGREALSNVVKHANAAIVRIVLAAEKGCLRFSVEDDGRGFNTSRDFSAAGHFGVTGMRERAAEMGAELMIMSGRGGTSVTLTVPFTGAAQLSQSACAGGHEATGSRGNA